ncbi:cytochrome P450 [Nocardioides immobilis]|uniref:Cytochrome P450 n=1 Tax=Nocardioides immobilis TaxID=2049295 RepID=A0A417Y5G1_9ACTN|nr:cytochrome P450 [Nocardioides immobilis]RHW27913.1 cytochrome P450 [Nocardioides immobilis]
MGHVYPEISTTTHDSASSSRTIHRTTSTLPECGHVVGARPARRSGPGNAAHLARDPLGTCLRAQQRYGDVVRLPVIWGEVFLLTHPDHVERVLVSNNANYWKGRLFRRADFLFGDGLVLNDGESWHRQRRIMQPGFHADRIVGRIVADRTEPRDDVLELLVAAASDGAMSPRLLRDEIITLLFGGYEATAHTLAWTWYELDRHPDVADRVRADTDGSFTRCVVDEVLRLYPPFWEVLRSSYEEDRFGDHVLPAGASVLLVPWMTHRRPELWDDPERFDPQRWRNGPPTHRHAYYPFAAGQRMCIGGRSHGSSSSSSYAGSARSSARDWRRVTRYGSGPRARCGPGTGSR